MEEKDKPSSVRFLHPENELFIAGKSRHPAQPHEVKHNIWLQIKHGDWGSGWYHVWMIVLIGSGTVFGLGMFALSSFLLPALANNVSKDWVFIGALLFWAVLGILGVFSSIFFIGYMLYNYFVYFRPMNIDGLYVLFKRNNVTAVQVNAIMPLDEPYIHISYLYKGHKGTLFEKRYLTTSPVDLEVGDWVYMAHIQGADIIL